MKRSETVRTYSQQYTHKHYSVSAYWDSRVLKNGVSRVLITINLNRQQFRVGVKLYCSKQDFIKATGSARVVSAEVKQLRTTINEYIAKAETILDKLPNPSKEMFVKLFKSELDFFVGDKTSLELLYDVKIADLKADGRVGLAKNCKNAKASLLAWRAGLCLEDIDEKALKQYTAYMLDKGCSTTTISMYLRSLKALFNSAIKEGVISEKQYPFKNVSTACSTKSKSVLYPNQVKALWNYETKGIMQTRSKAYFFFCYLCNGMNFKDMVHLRFKNINGETLTFVRQKTKNTIKTGIKEIQVHLHPEALKIIAEWGNKRKSPDDYIFPVLNGYKTASEQFGAMHRYRRVCNKKLSEMGKKLGFDVHLCLNLARHSFATALKLNGVPVAFISDAMGHTDTKTTQHYLKSLPDENRKQMSNMLL